MATPHATNMVTQLDNDPTYSAHDPLIIALNDSMNLVKAIESQNNGGKSVIFMDGPPFISVPSDPTARKTSGLHAGHCLVSEIKSCIMKFMNMEGYRCHPYTGTDNHGLPIESSVSKLLGLSTPNDIRAYGIDRFSKVCKDLIIKCETLWDPVYKSIGRLVDTDYRYKTMDTNFMESVMWVFKTLWDTSMIYLGWKVLPYSYKCGTVLSNFEVSQCYKDITDITAYVYFPMVGEDNTGFVAWTTTPWTLTTNMALCVNPDGNYVKVTDNDTGRSYIVNDQYVANLHISKQTIVPFGKGISLKGMSYLPPFNYYPTRQYLVICDSFVEITGGVGTGIVHISPMHGEVDYDVCLSNKIISMEEIIDLCDVDDMGNFNQRINGFTGVNVFDANPLIVEELKKMCLLVRKEKYTHSYPHSDRTGEPIIYMARSSYFVRVSAIKEQLLAMNSKVNWVPSHIGSGRFQKWLENAKDWSISRSRFFGTPVPVWVSEDGQETMCLGSIDDLVKYGNLSSRPTDLHPEFIDQITIVSPKTGKILKRVPFTLDCWFESGCVPYGQIHYPFENSDAFDNREYLSDFVCEGIDQTRGWFYTLLVLSTALLNKPAYKNVICTGLILDKEGKKLAKRNGNFKDPVEIIEKYGSDSLRMYLLGSPAVKAGDLKFDDDAIILSKQKLIQFHNGIKFFIEHYTSMTKSGHQLNDTSASQNILDQWIVIRTKQLISQLHHQLTTFDIDHCPPLINQFIEDFTNVFIKLNRNRLNGKSGDYEWITSMSVTRYVLINILKAVVPFMPFLAEYVYQHIKSLDNIDPKESIQLCKYPVVSGALSQSENQILSNVEILRDVLTKARSVRTKNGQSSSIRKPVKKLFIGHDDTNFLAFVDSFRDLLYDEVNCLEVEIGRIANYVTYVVKPNMKSFAQKYKTHMKNIKIIESHLNSDQVTLKLFYDNKTNPITYRTGTECLILTSNEIDVIPKTSSEMGEDVTSVMDGGLVVGIEHGTNSAPMLEKYVVRQFCIIVQNIRKKMGIHPWDEIVVNYQSTDMIQEILSKHLPECQLKLRCHLVNTSGVSGENSDLETLDGSVLGIITVSVRGLNPF